VTYRREVAAFRRITAEGITQIVREAVIEKKPKNWPTRLSANSADVGLTYWRPFFFRSPNFLFRVDLFRSDDGDYVKTPSRVPLGSLA